MQRPYAVPVAYLTRTVLELVALAAFAGLWWAERRKVRRLMAREIARQDARSRYAA